MIERSPDIRLKPALELGCNRATHEHERDMGNVGHAAPEFAVIDARGRG